MGAWTHFYSQGMGEPKGGTDNVSLAVLAIEKELVRLGFIIGNVNTHFGDGTTLAVKNFQLTERLLSDGVVGPKTAKALFEPRVAELELKHKIPDRLLCGIVYHESTFDPGAYGSVVPADKGLVQINLTSHPDITLAQAFDPAYALELCAMTLRVRHDSFAKTCPDISWDCAVCSWHSPRDAQEWCHSGKPNEAGIHYVDSVRAGCDS